MSSYNIFKIKRKHTQQQHFKGNYLIEKVFRLHKWVEDVT